MHRHAFGLTAAAFLFGAASTPALAQQELFRLTASDAFFHGERFGAAVAVDGPLAVIGAPFLEQPGSAYLFEVATGLERRHFEPQGGHEYDRAGGAVAIDGDLVVLGAVTDNERASNAGAAYVFDHTTGEQLYKLFAPSATEGELFGASVAMEDGLLVVGARYGTGGSPESTGEVHLFEAPTGQWLRTITPPDGETWDAFGDTLDLRDGLIAVGAIGHGPNGAAYVFDASDGAFVAKLTSPDALYGERFGWSVALAQDHALVGAPWGGDPVPLAGAVYVFDMESALQVDRWTVAGSGQLGTSLAISGELALVGSPYETESHFREGAAYAFELSSGAVVYDVRGSDTGNNDHFGLALDLDGDRAVLGAPDHNEPVQDAGKVYVIATAPLRFCFGDGSGAVCPCGNLGGEGAGCANSTLAGGALFDSGSGSVGADDLAFLASQLVPGQPVLLFVGQNEIADGAGILFGDGLRCAGGGVVRLGIQATDGAGDAAWGPGLAEKGGWSAGDARAFQAWYRDPAGPCGFGFNLTNGVRIELTP